MSIALHPHLKRGLDFEGLHISSDDAIVSLSEDEHNSQAQAAKRRRVEAIAMKCLQGQPPVIFSASLRGPFHNGWKNPWAENTQKKGTHVQRKTNTAKVASRHAEKRTRNDVITSRMTRRIRKVTKEKRNVTKIAAPSPEVPRAAGNHLDIDEDHDSLDEVEVLPATAPSQEQHGASSKADISIANNEECVQSRSCLTNPFWLRRPQFQRQVDINGPTSDDIDASPTRSRIRNLKPDLCPNHSLQLVPPMSRLGSHISSPNLKLLDDYRSSLSEPMCVKPRHDLIASPAPASSSGFVYRKVGKPRRVESSVPQSHTVCYNDSPADRNSILGPGKTSPHKQTTTSEARASKEDRSPAQLVDVDVTIARDDESGKVQNGVQLTPSDHSSTQSTFSTQAAMLLAQVEFQESTTPNTLSQTHRPWSQCQQDTSPPQFPEPSPAMTPLSVFSSKLDQSLSNVGLLHGSLISTQDLFGAASPFAFSTVKKKSEDWRRSSSRSTVHASHGDWSKTNNFPRKSPTPFADRVPLKEKNISTPLWSFVSNKASQVSSASKSRQSVVDVGISALDYSTSLEGIDPSIDLDFSDGLMRCIDAT